MKAFVFKLGVGVLVFTQLFPAGGNAEIEPVSIQRNAEAKTLKWREAVQIALRYNPDLKESHFNVLSSARSRDIALGEYLPSVSGDLARTRNNARSAPARDNIAFGVSADAPLFTGFTTTGAFLTARKNLQATQWTYQDTSANVRFRLRASYVELLRLSRQLEVNRRIEERRKKNADLIQLRYEAGREHLGSALRAKAIADQSAEDFLQTNRRIESESLRLGREAGGQFELPLQVEGQLEQLVPEIMSTQPDFAALAEEVPSVKSAVKSAEAAKANILAVQGRVWPQINGSADYGYSGRDVSDLKSDSFIGVAMSMPFFSGGQNVAAIRKAKADYDAAQANAKSARDEAVAQLAEAWVQYVNAIRQVAIRERFLEAARKRSEIVRAEYESGLVNFQDFDITEQDIADSERNYVESLATALVQEANWDLTRGKTLEDVLREERT